MMMMMMWMKMNVVHLAELGLHMLFGEDGEVLVHDLASECFFSVEVADYVLGILCHIEKFLNSHINM